MLSQLSRRLNDHRLLTMLEVCEISGALLLVRYGHSTSNFWLVSFVFGSLLMYYNNSGQSGVLSSQLLKNSVPGHTWLDSVRLLAIYNCMCMLGVMVGPTVSRAVLSIAYTQNSPAFALF